VSHAKHGEQLVRHSNRQKCHLLFPFNWFIRRTWDGLTREYHRFDAQSLGLSATARRPRLLLVVGHYYSMIGGLTSDEYNWGSPYFNALPPLGSIKRLITVYYNDHRRKKKCCSKSDEMASALAMRGGFLAT
jgi:hypothetical protein